MLTIVIHQNHIIHIISHRIINLLDIILLNMMLKINTE
nr:MAG TPA: hypothetical protein [Caudoviricetes sp.]